MKYCSAPTLFHREPDTGTVSIERPITDPLIAIDNWIDTVVFTAIRRFKADEDFGFSFWDNEFIAMNLADFNNGVDFKVVMKRKGVKELKRMSSAAIKVCERSILNSIQFYVPYLKDVKVNISLSYEKGTATGRSRKSKYSVKVKVNAHTCYDEYSGTNDGEYHKEAVFYMDPFFQG